MGRCRKRKFAHQYKRTHTNNAQSDNSGPLVVAESPADAGSVFAQAGFTNVGWGMGKRGERYKTAVTFPYSYSTTPTIISGIRLYDVAQGLKMNIGEESSDNVTPAGFQATTYSIDDSPTFGVSNAWMVLPQNEIAFQTGELTLSGIETRPKVDVKVMFPRKYKSDPKVVCWLKAVTTTTKGDWPNHRVTCDVKATGPDFAIIRIETWASTDLIDAKVGWLAWDREQDGRLIKTGTIYTAPGDAANKDYNKEVRFESSFNKNPAVFLAFNGWDIKTNDNLRAQAVVNGVEKDRFKANLGTWGPTGMDSMGARWIAIEGP